MKVLLVLSVVTVLFQASLTTAESIEISCSDLKHVAVLGSFFISFSNNDKKDVEVIFSLSTNKVRNPIDINTLDWSGLQSHAFDPSKRTIFIIHGFKSGGKKSWVLDLKDRLLDREEANVILVDWSDGSNKKNYVNAARNTILTTNRIFNFLQALRPQVEKLGKSSSLIRWNHLYFIGHSLGAQISGQIAHLLKRDNFWTVERITGLDPAKPCFSEIDPTLKIDKNDADFVDIIHTQAGKSDGIDALGLKESVGHIDFFVNGGVVQPECVGSMITPKWDTMICSHKLAYKYFTESLDDFTAGRCNFGSYKWDGTYRDAQRILTNKLLGLSCSGCPDMGINSINSTERGTFLVITSTKIPHCQFGNQDLKDVIKVIRRLK